MRKQPCVYIMASKRNGTIYTGVTSNIQHRSWQHRVGLIQGFTKKYNIKLLVFFEHFESMRDAIRREKQLKTRSRKRKLELIESRNPGWHDLFGELF